MFLKNLVVLVLFLFIATPVFAEGYYGSAKPMGYFYYNNAEKDYAEGNYQSAIDNYILASRGFQEEGNVEMQGRSYDKLGKSKLQNDSVKREAQNRLENDHRYTAR